MDLNTLYTKFLHPLHIVFQVSLFFESFESAKKSHLFHIKNNTIININLKVTP